MITHLPTTKTKPIVSTTIVNNRIEVEYNLKEVFNNKLN